MLNRLLPRLSTRSRIAVSAAFVAALAAIAATVASAALHRSAFYSCPPGSAPTVSSVSWDSGSALTRSIKVTATIASGGAPTVVQYGTAPLFVTELPGANNDLAFTGLDFGDGDVHPSVSYINPGTPNQAFSLVANTLSGQITVHLATDGTSTVTTTANSVRSAIQASAAAQTLVRVANVLGNDGSGIVNGTSGSLTGGGAVMGLQPVALPPGTTQTVDLELTELDPDAIYGIVVVATNQCAEPGNKDSESVSVQTAAEAGVHVLGRWDSNPGDPDATIGGTVTIAADPNGGGAGANDSNIVCGGTLTWLKTVAPVGTSFDLGESPCEAHFTSGASVILTATPAPNSFFAGWEGLDCAPWGLQSVCYTVVTGALDDSAIFTTRPTVRVAFIGSGDGTVVSSPAGINCTAVTPTCQAQFTPGTSITFTATQATGNAFDGWGGDAAKCGTATTCTLVATTDLSVSASFTGKPSLYVLRTGSGTGTVTSQTKEIDCSDVSVLCSASYAVGSKVVLTATPGPGSTFAGWGTDLASCSGASTTCTITALLSETVTAVFSDGYTLTVTPAGSGSGTVTSSPAGISCPTLCSAVFPEGTQVTLNALAGAGSTFDGWDDGPCFDRDDSVPCAITLVDDMQLPVLFTNPSASALKSRTSFKGCTIVGTPRNDILVGRGHDVVCGGGGNDRLVGVGNDVLIGGTGNDQLSCAGSCRLYGGAGTDTLIARGSGLSQLFGEAGNDLLLARNNTKNVLDGGSGRNRARFDRRLDVLRRIQVKLTK